MALRNITHLIYDTAYTLALLTDNLNADDQQAITTRLDKLIGECDYLAVHDKTDFVKFRVDGQYGQNLIIPDSRICSNLNGIDEMLARINDLFAKIF
jgi:hypothetical protein